MPANAHVPRVTSPDNPRLKQAMRLISSSRERRKAGLCVLEGVNLVDVYLDRRGVPETVIALEDEGTGARLRGLRERIPSGRVLTLAAGDWTALTQLPTEIAVVAVVPTPTPVPGRVADFCVLLEDVQDPGNVGSILRSAAASGVAQVFMSPGCAFAWSPKVLRAGQGGHFHLDIFEHVDLSAWMRAFHGKSVAAVAANGEPLFESDLRAPVAVVIGNEGAGLSQAVCDAATRRVTIPMPGGFESLNAAAAAAVCLFECVRQRPPRSVQHR
ncbi:MAG: RNA methyltransferase [Betaproteobacteria bacterium]